MASVLLAIDIIIAVALTILVLLQRSEGGALGALGGGGGNSMFTGRQAGNMLTRLTWWLFAIFVVVNLSLVVIAKKTTEVQPVSILPTSAPVQSAPVENAPTAPLSQAENAPAPTVDGQNMPSPAAQDTPALEINIEAPELPRVPYSQDQDPSLPAGI